MSIETPSNQTTEDTYDSLPLNLQEVLLDIPKLEETGANYTNWSECLHKVVDSTTGTPDYLSMTLDPSDDGDFMIAAMIRSSVSASLRSHLSHSFSAKETYERIRSICNRPGVPNQIDLELWREILNTRYDPTEGVSAYIDRMKSKFDELNQTGFVWNRESMASVFLHMDLPSNMAAGWISSPSMF